MTYEAWRATFQSSEQAARSAYRELKAAYAQNAEPVHQFQPESMDEGWIDCNERDLKIYQQDGHWPTRTLYTKPQVAVPENVRETLHKLAQGLDNLKRNTSDAYDYNYIAAMLKDVDGLLTTSAVYGETHHEG